MSWLSLAVCHTPACVSINHYGVSGARRKREPCRHAAQSGSPQGGVPIVVGQSGNSAGGEGGQRLAASGCGGPRGDVMGGGVSMTER